MRTGHWAIICAWLCLIAAGVWSTKQNDTVSEICIIGAGTFCVVAALYAWIELKGK